MTVLRSQRGEVAGHDPAKGSFKKWLKGVVHNRIRSLRRKDQKERPLAPVGSEAEEEGDALPDIPQPPEDFEEMDEHQWHKAILHAALQRVRERVTEDNFAIFLALLEEKASPDELGETYGKTTNNVYRIKNSCQTMLKSEAKAIQEVWNQMGRAPAASTTYA